MRGKTENRNGERLRTERERKGEGEIYKERLRQKGKERIRRKEKETKKLEKRGEK